VVFCKNRQRSLYILLEVLFIPAIRNELHHHAHNWNKHRVRKMKNVRSLSEIPNMMYTTAELYYCTEQSKVADEVEVDHCLQIKTVMNVISIAVKNVFRLGPFCH
jgi:hypothetical protein